MNKTAFLSLILVGGVLAPVFSYAEDNDRSVVYTLSNEPTGNRVLSFVRQHNGHLRSGPSFPTGGLGTGHGLGSQGALSLSADGRSLVAVNAGSNSISLFRRDGDDIDFSDIEPSGGATPISVTQHGRFVYVLNAGDANTAANIQGFVRFNGGLVAIPGATALLSAPNPGPAEVKFNPAGGSLVVTEKNTNRIDIFVLDFLGRPIASSFSASVGQTPFGFDFDHRGRLFVSEAFGGAPNASTLSSYRIIAELNLDTITPSAPTFQTAACWAVVSRDNRFVYATNTGSGNVTGYRIGHDGSVSLLSSNGITGITGGSPIDAAISGNNRFLEVLTTGATHSVVTFRIKEHGGLEKIDAAGGLPASSVGLEAR